MKNLDFLEKKTKGFIEQITALGGEPIYKLPVQEARKVLDNLQAKTVEKLPILIEDSSIPVDPDGKVSIKIVRPSNQSGKLPVVMYFHGVGWIFGNHDTHDLLIREIACGANAAVVFVNYTPCPEAKYPKPIEEAYAATKYITEYGEDFNLDPTRLAVAADSVSGNVVTVVSLLAKERKGPKICYQVLFYPVTDANFKSPSYQQFAEGPWPTKAAIQWFWDAYEPNVSNRKKSTVCPLQASLDELRNLPPTLLITDENDLLRDEGEAYAHKLMEAGVEVAVIRYLGAIHDFVLLNPICDAPAATSAIAVATANLQSAFIQQKSVKQRGAA